MKDMKKTPQDIDDLLLDYIDDNLIPEERSRIESLLSLSADLTRRLAHLRNIHAMVGGQQLEQPSGNFTLSVMNRLDEYPAKTSFSARNSIFLLLGIIGVMAIGAWLLSVGVFDHAGAILDLNKLPLSRQYMKQTLPVFSIDGKLVIHVIIFLNLALVLIVFDRVILKPFFHRRIQTGH
jgi:anti-sigma factor RsiW